MGLVFSDGCDSYASGSNFSQRWNLTGAVGGDWSWSSSAGRFGTGAIIATGSTGGQLLYATGAMANNNGSLCGYFKISGAPAADSVFVLGTTNGQSFGLGVRAGSGTCFGYLGSNLSFGAPPVIADNKFHWLEVFCNFGPGNLTLYCDGTLCGTAGNGFPATLLGPQLKSVAGITVTYDDVLFYDPAGAGLNSFPLGPLQISTSKATTDGALQFGTVVGGTGTHASCVNETAPDGDTSYVQDGTAGNQDLLNFAALGFTPAAIKAVVENIYVENAIGGSINIQGICKSNVTQTNGAAQLTPTAYRTLQQAFYVDPNTAAAWTAAGLNAAQFGYKNA